MSLSTMAHAEHYRVRLHEIAEQIKGYNPYLSVYLSRHKKHEYVDVLMNIFFMGENSAPLLNLLKEQNPETLMDFLKKVLEMISVCVTGDLKSFVLECDSAVELDFSIVLEDRIEQLCIDAVRHMQQRMHNLYLEDSKNVVSQLHLLSKVASRRQEHAELSAEQDAYWQLFLDAVEKVAREQQEWFLSRVKFHLVKCELERVMLFTTSDDELVRLTLLEKNHSYTNLMEFINNFI